MKQREAVRGAYLKFREDFNKDTSMCLSFLKWLHESKGDVMHLKGMEGLTQVEYQYIDQLLEGKVK